MIGLVLAHGDAIAAMWALALGTPPAAAVVTGAWLVLFIHRRRRASVKPALQPSATLRVTVALLASIHPALVLLAAFAIPTVVTSTWRPAVERVAQERAAPHDRLARHLFTTATTAPGTMVFTIP